MDTKMRIMGLPVRIPHYGLRTMISEIWSNVGGWTDMDAVFPGIQQAVASSMATLTSRSVPPGAVIINPGSVQVVARDTYKDTGGDIVLIDSVSLENVRLLRGPGAEPVMSGSVGSEDTRKILAHLRAREDGWRKVINDGNSTNIEKAVAELCMSEVRAMIGQICYMMGIDLRDEDRSSPLAPVVPGDTLVKI
jgi:hypothetical protein